MTKHTAMELAIEAKSAGYSTIDDVAGVVSVWCPELADPYGVDEATEAQFADLVNEVMALLPVARFDRKKAAEWSRADADFRACERAENFTPFGCAA